MTRDTWKKLGDIVSEKRLLAGNKHPLEDRDVSFAFNERTEAFGIKGAFTTRISIVEYRIHDFTQPQINVIRSFIITGDTSYSVDTALFGHCFVVTMYKVIADADNFLADVEVVHALPSHEHRPAPKGLQYGAGRAGPPVVAAE